jgi:hypothetical protein
MKIKLSLGYLALVCVIFGCDKKPSLPPTISQPTQSVNPTPNSNPVAQPPATPPPAPEVAVIAQKPVQPAEVVDLGSLMNRIPTNEFALSDEGGWDKFTMPKVQRWVNDNLVGKRGRVNACVLQCNVNQEDATSKPDEWTVSLQITGIHATYAGLPNRILPTDKDDQTDHSPDIGTWAKATFNFKCNETDARKWDALNKKISPAVTVEGDVVGINFQPHFGSDFNNSFIGYDTFIQLDNIVLTPSNDTGPGALYLSEVVMAQYGALREPDEAITEIRRLETNGDYQLIFMKNDRWVSQGNQFTNEVATQLISFPLIEESLSDFNDKMKFTPCDDPPTESQIAQAKEATGWPKN